jgi:hypothetical protein
VVSGDAVAGNKDQPFYFSNDAGNSAHADQLYSPGPAEACVWEETTNVPSTCLTQQS